MRIQPMTSRRTRVPRARPTAVLATSAALACAALVSACGSSSSEPAAKTNLDTKRVAAAIQQSILTKRKLNATVTCPAVEPQEKGKTFTCTAVTTTTSKGKTPVTTKTPFKVTVQNNKGYATYQGE
jgi:hypothetical protein